MRIEVLRQLNRRAKPARHKLAAGWCSLLGRSDQAAVWLSRIAKGMFAPEETRLLYRTVCELEGEGDIAEIGSWMGRTSIVMGLALRDSGQTGRRIYAIDPHVGSEEHQEYIAHHGPTFAEFRRNVSDAGLDALVEPLVMRSVDGASQLAARGARLRLTFIDGAHDEASVREDIEAFLPLMQPRGVVALHDCGPDGGWPGVNAAFAALLEPHVDVIGQAGSLFVTRLRR
jgi:predicted O-methyltransferase YrrM